MASLETAYRKFQVQLEFKTEESLHFVSSIVLYYHHQYWIKLYTKLSIEPRIFISVTFGLNYEFLLSLNNVEKNKINFVRVLRGRF